MNSFSNDVDLLKYEPKLFTEHYFPSQILTSGTGAVLAGTTLMTAGENFPAEGVTAGGVVYLKSADGTVDGVFEIVSVNSATQLTVSILRSDAKAAPIPPLACTDVTYRIATFAPQASEAAATLMRCFDIEPEDSANLLEPDELKQASVFLVLSMVYATLSGDEATSEEFWKKSLYYRQLFEQMRDILKLAIDTDGDGQSDEVKHGGEIKLVRE